MEIKAETNSKDLLSCGNTEGFHDKLLLKPKGGRSLQTERVPRSNVLDRLQSFLPQMAQANQKLKQQMDECPPGHFDIERVEEAEKVIEMDVALVELSGSDGDSAEETEEEEDSDSEESEITEDNLKLPGDKNEKKNRANIQVLDTEDDEDVVASE